MAQNGVCGCKKGTTSIGVHCLDDVKQFNFLSDKKKKYFLLYGVFLHTYFPSVTNHVKLQIDGWMDENKCVLVVYSNAMQLRKKKSCSLLLLLNLRAEQNKCTFVY